jgi:hypothetical protein
MSIPSFRSRQELFDFLDGYARERKEEIDRWQLGKHKGLIKSYVLETAPPDGSDQIDIAATLRPTGWQITPIDSGMLYLVDNAEGKHLGYLESLSNRYLILHSIEEARWTDKTVRGDVRETASLDSMWLAGGFFSNLWQIVILPQLPKSYVKLKFEHFARFENGVEETEEVDEELEDDWVVEGGEERRASSLMIAERVDRIAEFLPELQHIHYPFKAIKMLRIPSMTGRGGYEFWTWGKVTYWAPDFRDGRSQIISITRLHEQVTQAIERTIWVQVEETKLPESIDATLRGAPVTLEFAPPLDLSTFKNFVTTTFERGQGPLRLWGNPIYLSDKKVHVYGVDLHLWQRIYLDLTPKRFVMILPRGTCGNTVHRLITNIQRYLDPGVKTFIGDRPYDDLIRDTLLGRENRP